MILSGLLIFFQSSSVGLFGSAGLKSPDPPGPGGEAPQLPALWVGGAQESLLAHPEAMVLMNSKLLLPGEAVNLKELSEERQRQNQDLQVTLNKVGE